MNIKHTLGISNLFITKLNANKVPYWSRLESLHSARKLIVSTLLILIGVSSTITLVQGFQVGEVAPGFVLKSIAGEHVKLEDFKGRPVLIKIGATWCPSCLEQSKEIEKAQEALNDKNIIHLEIFLRDEIAAVQNYVDRLQVEKRPVALLDDGSVMHDFRVYLIPRILLIDQEGKVFFDKLSMSAMEITESISALTD